MEFTISEKHNKNECLGGYDAEWDRLPLLIPRELRLEVSERILGNGVGIDPQSLSMNWPQTTQVRQSRHQGVQA
jgi:hypothetical protein